jgi:hypothetical protein
MSADWVRCYVCGRVIVANDLLGYVEEIGQGEGPTSSEPRPSRFHHRLCLAGDTGGER